MREILVLINDGVIWVGEDITSGSEYEGSTYEDVGRAVQRYLEDNEEVTN